MHKVYVLYEVGTEFLHVI